MSVPRIYKFENGAEIDLQKVVFVGGFDKDQYYNYFFNVHCEGLKPVQIVVCNAIGGVTPEQKTRAQTIKETFTKAWNLYLVLRDSRLKLDQDKRFDNYLRKFDENLINEIRNFYSED